MKKGILLFLIIVLNWPAIAVSTTVIKMNYRQLTESSDLVFIGTVQNISSGTKKSEKDIHTYVTFKNLDILKGEYSDPKITVKLKGGSDGKIRLKVEGMPEFRKGKRSIIFLRENGKAICPIMGWWQGILKVIKGKVYQIDHDGRLLLKQGLNGQIETVQTFKKRIKGILEGPTYEEKSHSSPENLNVEPGIIKKKQFFSTYICGPYASEWADSRVTMFPLALGADIALYAESMMATWNAVSTSEFIFNVVRNTYVYPVTYDGINALGMVSSGGTGALAVTTTRDSLLTCERIESDILFDNDILWGFYGESDAIDFPSVALHELGHVLGLKHSSSGTVMQAAISAGNIMRSPTQDDIDGISYLYPVANNTGGDDNSDDSGGDNSGGTGDGDTDTTSGGDDTDTGGTDTGDDTNTGGNTDTGGGDSNGDKPEEKDTESPVNKSNNFINNGKTSTDGWSVTLTLAATDNTGVTGYFASETSVTPSANWDGWKTVTSVSDYKSTVYFNLKKEKGQRMVYVWFKDMESNVSEGASDDITLPQKALKSPVITSFSPKSGPAGITVAIRGENFANNNSKKKKGEKAKTPRPVVRFNRKRAEVIFVNRAGTLMRAVVPSGSKTGPITVTFDKVTAGSENNFTVIKTGGDVPTEGRLKIERFSPKSGKEGTIVTIFGKKFSPIKGKNTVKFGNAKAVVQFANRKGTKLKVKVPKKTKTGQIMVKVGKKTAKSKTKFLVK